MARSAIGLALVVAGVNVGFFHSETIFAASPNPWDRYADVDLSQAKATLGAITSATDLLATPDAALVGVALAASGSGDFLTKPAATETATEPTQLEQRYTVGEGDTISSIAEHFGLHVATILDRNQLSVDDIETLSPGQTLTIPAADTSDSTDWLVALNDKKAADAAKAAAAEQAALASAAATRFGRSTVSRETTSVGYSGANQMVGSFIVPLNYDYVARGVGYGHQGIDYVAPSGTPVVAAAAGRVVEITGAWGGGFGISVVVDHGGGLTTRYAHLSAAEVGIGQSVGQGDEVGLSGNTGFSTGPHLHFQTEQSGRVISPF